MDIFIINKHITNKMYAAVAVAGSMATRYYDDDDDDDQTDHPVSHHHHNNEGAGGFVHFQGFVDSSTFSYRRPEVIKRPRTASIYSKKSLPLLGDDVTTVYVDIGLSPRVWEMALEKVPNTESIVFSHRSRSRRLTIDQLAQALTQLPALRKVDLRTWSLTEEDKDHLLHKYHYIRFRF